MSKSKTNSIAVKGTVVAVLSQNGLDFISLTDMAKKLGDDVLIYSWMRNRNTLEFIGIREQLHTPSRKRSSRQPSPRRRRRLSTPAKPTCRA